MIRWTKEIDDFMITHVTGMYNKDLTQLINQTFNMDFTPAAVWQHKNKLGIKSGIITRLNGTTGQSHRFQKGHVPANKGKKMSAETFEKIKPTLFQKGNKTWNTRPLYSERTGKDNFIYIKVAEPNLWKPKQVYIWEQAHNEEVKKGEVVLFLDGNNRNFDPVNLEKLTRAELCKLNQVFERTTNPEETMNHILQVRISLARLKRARENGLVNNHGQIPEDVKASAKRSYARVSSNPELKAKRNACTKRWIKKQDLDPVKRAKRLKQLGAARCRRALRAGLHVKPETLRKYGVYETDFQ